MIFSFDGNWNFKLTIDAFKGLQSRGGSYAGMSSTEPSNGDVQINIMEVEDEIYEPLPEQINAINFLLNNSAQLKDNLITALHHYVPDLKSMYFHNDHSEEALNYFPSTSEPEKYAALFGVGTVHVLMHHKEDISYIGIECGCNWDEEHGLGFVVHKNEVISIGCADDSFSEWKAIRDLGIVKSLYPEKRVTKLYTAHPQYLTHKPSHQRANEDYGFRLIDKNLYVDFVKLIEFQNHSVDFTQEGSWNKWRYIKAAVRLDMQRFFDFLIYKNADLNGCIEVAILQKNSYYLKTLLKLGRSINEKNQSGLAPLAERLEIYLIQYQKCYSPEILDKHLENKRSLIMAYENRGVFISDEKKKVWLKNPIDSLREIGIEINNLKNMGAIISFVERRKVLSAYERKDYFELFKFQASRVINISRKEKLEEIATIAKERSEREESLVQWYRKSKNK